MESPLLQLREQSPVTMPEEVWERLGAAYQEPHRRYHTLQHLLEMAAHYQAVATGPGWKDPRSSWLALLFHDVVYQIQVMPGDNEAASATLLQHLLPEADAAAHLIHLTATHGTAIHEILTEDAALFLDCDLMILAAAPGRFAEYEQQIAEEYLPFIGEEAYGAGRMNFLERMLASPRLFHSDWFHQRADADARRNLSTALSRLSAGA